jgi:hypothetical protein
MIYDYPKAIPPDKMKKKNTQLKSGTGWTSPVKKQYVLLERKSTNTFRLRRIPCWTIIPKQDFLQNRFERKQHMKKRVK